MEKAEEYIQGSDGGIRAVLVVDIDYPTADKATVGLCVADTSSSDEANDKDDDSDNASSRPVWVQQASVFYRSSGYSEEEQPMEQPIGQVSLYLSDFLGSGNNLSAAFCRPTTAELAANVTRFVSCLSPSPYPSDAIGES